MAMYTRRGSRFRVRWRDPGAKNPRSYSVPDEQTAREFAAEASRCEARGEPWVPPPERVAPVAGRKLEDLAIAWLEEIKRTVRPATVVAYADNLGRFVEFATSYLGRAPLLPDLTPEVVRAFDAKHQEQGLSVYTRRARYAPISSWAGWLEAEHPDVFRAAPVKAVRMPRAPKPKPLALTWAEVDALVHGMGGLGQAAAMIARCTGLRRGVVVGLKWGDCEVMADGRAYLDVPDEITKGGRSGRRIPIAPVLARYLESRRAGLREEPVPEDRIVPITGMSFSSMTSLAINDMVANGVVRADAQKVRSSTHLFRKAFISNLRRTGADADAVEFLVGHDIGVKAHYLDLDSLMWEAVQLVPEVVEENAEWRAEPVSDCAGAVEVTTVVGVSAG